MRGGVLLTAILFAAAALPAGAGPPLSGKWILEVAQSDFGNAARLTRATAEYTLRGDVANAIQISSVAGGQQKNQMTWYLDGLRHPSQQPAPGYSITHWNGHTLVNERSSSDGIYAETIRVTLSPDGRTATEIVDAKTPHGSNHEKLIWKRAQ
ncbi:MAG: hypothetical protein ACRD4O_09975 [Bryobacteraceae bacterium]